MTTKRDTRIKIGTPVDVVDRGQGTVVSHGKDFFGSYTEVRLDGGTVLKVHRFNVKKRPK